MKNIQQPLHKIRKRAWEHKKALFHMDRAIKEMEMKSYRAQEYFEYLDALNILKNYRVFTA